MTNDQVREWRLRAASGPNSRLHHASINDLREFARLARAEAFEAAAKECEDMAKRSHSNTAVLIAAAENIRAFAEREKEPRP